MKNDVVGRAELKLAEAAEVFGYDFRGKIVLDIGSSTGGFTEFALKNGAKKVIAVEKGTNQMKAPLRFDSKIDLREKTDIFKVITRRDAEESQTDFAEEKLVISIPDVILADVSFVSMEKILIYAKKNLMGMKTDFLAMVKPQFEARPEELVRGVVKNERMRREILQKFERFALKNGFLIVKKHDNSVVGRNGNRERFYWLVKARK